MQISLETGNKTPICTYQNATYLHVASNKLAIEINFDGFSFCAIYPTSNLELLQVWKFSIDFNLAKTQLSDFIDHVFYFSRATLELEWEETFLFFTGSENTLIPTSVYSQETLAQSMHLLFDSANDMQLKEVPFSEFNSQMGFLIPDAVVKGISAYPHHKLKIQSGLRGWLLYNYNHVQSAGTSIYLLVQNSQLFMSIFESKSLKFFNSFYFLEATDLAYFVLNTLKQINQSVNEVKFFMGGTLSQNDNEFKVLATYIPNLVRISPEQIYNVDDLPAFSKHHLLLANILCA